MRTQTIVDGIGVPQALRWHGGALWFSDIAAGTVHRWDGSGLARTVSDVAGAGGLGWLPDGRMLVVSTEDQCVYRQKQDHSLRVHADLSDVAGGALNDLIVDEDGRAYVGNYGFDYEERTRDRAHSFLYRPPGPTPTPIACLAPDGALIGLSAPPEFPNGCTFVDRRTLVVAETLAFRLTAFTVSGDDLLVDPRPSASLISPRLWKAVTSGSPVGTVTRRISALLEHPRISALSRSPIAPDDLATAGDGTILVADSLHGQCVRIGRSGAVLERVDTSAHTLSCALGGEDGRTLFVATVPTLDPDAVGGTARQPYRMPPVATGAERKRNDTTRGAVVVTGQVVFITGAASGIGAATARIAARRGYRVMLADVNGPAVAELAAQVGPAAGWVRLDVRDATDWEAAYDSTLERFGSLDVLVNNAGIIHTGNARSLSFAEHRDIVEVNLLGTMAGVLTALPRMSARGKGHIINVCSMTSFLPLSGYATYSGTKHGMRAFHHSVAIEERDGPVTFSIIHPPSTRTPMLAQELADPSSVIAFAEKSHSADDIAAVIVDAITKKPVEVVFPAWAGRVQRVAGVFPHLMHWAIPRVASSGRKRRAKLHGSPERLEGIS
jgi:NAD(P)-dependent dehydrogenase (short-subunit alcohol dehydrogenase family)/sugar lactone lactonase YvrE